MAQMGDSERESLNSRESELQQTRREEDCVHVQEGTGGTTRPLLRWLPWAILNLVVVGTSIIVGSVACVGTMITLAIFSPILVPVGFLLLITVGGALAIVTVSLAAISACYVLYKHIKSSNVNETSATNEDHSTTDYPKQVLAASGA